MESYIQQQNARSTDQLVENDGGKKSIGLNILQCLRRFRCNSIDPDNQRVRKRHFYAKMRSKIVKGLIFLLIFSLAVPTLIYFFMFHKALSRGEELHTCLVHWDYRVFCGKTNLTHKQCSSIDCCYDPNTKGCYHYLPSKYLYKLKGDGSYETANFYTPLNSLSIKKLSLSIIDLDENRLRIALHEPEVAFNKTLVATTAYHTIVDNETLSVEVFRKSDNARLLSTKLGPLIASKAYWEWTFTMSSKIMWGLGEIVLEENATITKVVYKNRNDHTTLPIFMAHQNGSYHGVVVEHEGPLEVTVLPSKLVVLRSLAGRSLVLQLSLGPTPADVVRQQRVVEPKLPPYWALGAHICREGNATLASIIEEYNKWKAESKNDVAFASDCLHESLYFLLQEATSAEIEEIKKLVGEIERTSKFIMSMPPHVLVGEHPIYREAARLDLLYKNQTRRPLNGTHLGKQVAYPDYSHPSVDEWFGTLLGIAPTKRRDGFALTSNWPTWDNLTFSDVNGSFPYLTKALNDALSDTIPWNATGYDSNKHHIILHNFYGSQQTEMFSRNLNATLEGEESFLMSASYHRGNKEAALVQNVNISWYNLKKAIHRSLSHSIFANPLVAFPVCGDSQHFDGKLDESLCLRWYITAASMPLFRISSDHPRRDPSSLKTQHAVNVAKDAIEKRRSFLPYYHTTLRLGEPLIRPMFYDFYWDNQTFSLGEQYMVGDSLLVAQPVLPGVSTISLYLPPSMEVWYEFWGGIRYTKLGKISFDVVATDWVTFIAGGKIVPMVMKSDSANGEDTLMLAVALNGTGATANSTASRFSSGKLFLKEGFLGLTANSTGVIVGNLSAVSRREMGCGGGGVSGVLPRIIGGVKLFGEGDFPQVFRKNISLCDGNVGGGGELYFAYR